MDFCQSEPDFSKVPLYQPDHIAFLNKDQPPLFAGTEETTHPLTNTPITTSSASSNAWTPPSSSSYDLQQVLLQYRSQPDLLQLILESKLQEDRRRTEEARLKAKELDLMLLQQHHQLNQQPQGTFTTTSLLSSAVVPPPPPLPSSSSAAATAAATVTTSVCAAADSVSSSTASSSPCSSLTDSSQQPQTTSIPMKRRDSSLFSNTDDLDNALFLQQMTNSLPESIDTQHHTHESLSPCGIPDFYQLNSSSTHKELMMASPPSTQKPRKRREMQAITKLVETRENPYLDGHFWRNNGNTIQKKTGNKSVYFKCSNSTKGCPVNKTSTYSQETGEYLIKYRGEHLPECGKVQHIVEV